MRVLISADMEGIAGVVDFAQTEPGAREFEQSRRLMTLEVNAAIEGALEAGVQEILVADSHWSMRNLIPEEMHPRAELLSGHPRTLEMAAGIGPGFDAAFFVGYHAAAGTRDGSMAHTYSDPGLTLGIRINRITQTEGSLNAAAVGYHGCPLALFTGDSAAVAQIHEHVPEVEGVVVKEGIGNRAGRSLHPQIARDRIRIGARRAIERADSIPALRLSGGLELEIDFVFAGSADACEAIPGVRRPADRTISWHGEDYLELYRLMLALIALGEGAQA